MKTETKQELRDNLKLFITETRKLKKEIRKIKRVVKLNLSIKKNLSQSIKSHIDDKKKLKKEHDKLEHDLRIQIENLEQLLKTESYKLVHSNEMIDKWKNESSYKDNVIWYLESKLDLQLKK